MSKSSGALRNIWMLTREYEGLAGTGGVKDMVKQLAASLARWSGRSVHVILPCYGFIRAEELGFAPVADPDNPGRILEFAVNMNYTDVDREETVRVLEKKIGRVRVYLLEAERFSEKADVYTYTSAEEGTQAWIKQGDGHVDYFAMNILLQKGALALMQRLGEQPDIIHCHDGHTAVLPAMIREIDGFRHFFNKSATVVTIHNAGIGYHQEVEDLPFAQAVTGLSRKTIYENRLGDTFDPLIVAGRYALVNTVSENYARELQETRDDQMTGWLGHRLAEMGVVLEGVTNGIDPDAFDPSRPEDSGITAVFDPSGDDDLEGKKKCKSAILQKLSGSEILPGVWRFGSLEPDLEKPLFTFIGRLSDQKGVDVLISSLRQTLNQIKDFRILLLGTGGVWEENQIIGLTEQRGSKGRVCFLRGFNPAIANQIYAAGDFFLIPSRYEPCGLTDYISQLFGNIPIVHYVGGLVKVVDAKTGFTYKKDTADDLTSAIVRAESCYRSPGCVRKMQREAVAKIRKHHTWDKVSKRYLHLYRRAKQQLM